MEAAEREQRRRKVEAGRAKLAHFRQRKTKGDCANSEKKTSKRKGSAVDAPVQEESPVASEDGARLGGGAVCRSTACIDSPDAERGAYAAQKCFSPLQTVHSLELEALRLSLSNMHTVQLELTQANLQKEKETALTELREMLNSRRAQELALLQSRQQHALELLREQHAREKEEMALRRSQETAELKEKLQSEMEKNVQVMEALKQDWESERDLCLEKLRKELSAKHQLEMEDLRSQFQEELAEQKAELEKIFQAKNQAESTLENLEAQHEAVIKKLREDLQSEHCRYLENLELKFKEKEREKQLELETLQASYEDLQAQSQQEIRHLWSKLESTGTNRQELNGEESYQLLARVSHVEELENLKRDFEQQQQQEKTQHESELEQLRIYFEEKLRDAEKTYQEDLILLQHRLQEVKEDSLLESVEISSSCACLEETPEKEKTGCLDQLDLQPEQHEVKHNLVEAHQEELNKTKEKNQLMKQELKKKEAEWKVLSEDLKREAEEKLTLMLFELREKAESEKRSALNKFELREEEMRQLQDQQATQILALEQSLAEQQGRLQQLEQGLAAEEPLLGSPCGDREHVPRVQEDCALQLMLAQNRFLEERKVIAEKFNAEQDAVLREAEEQHARELQLLQERHQQQLQAVSQELEARHQAELHELAASLENEQRALLDARVAELQAKHAAEIRALEARHRSSLDSVESCCLAEMQTVRGEHRRALARLQADFTEQLQRKDAAHQAVLSQELEKLKLKRDKELQSAQDGPRGDTSAGPVTSLEAPAPELPGARQVRHPALLLHCEAVVKKDDGDLTRALSPSQSVWSPGRLLSDWQVCSTQVAVWTEGAFTSPSWLSDIDVTTLFGMVEESHSELEMLQQRRERENQEGENLISMLKADVDLSHSERRALQDALRRLLALFGETLQAAVALRSRIGERVGLCLDDAGADQALPAAPTLDETWSDAALLEVDRTVSECAETSSAAEVSSHVRESFLMSPDSARGCEQTVRRVYQSLGLAVDGLLEMVLDSTRQLEEARQIHSRFEKEFSCKNEETVQVIRKHKELLAHLEEQSAAKAGLELQLHTAEGILEGLKVEKADLQEVLGRKEESERHLVLELEGLRRQLGQAAREQAALKEECGRLWSQKEAWAAEAEEREAALRKEVECLTKEQSETRKQSEKDRSALLSQMKVLECELEEQLSRHQGCARQAEEVTALKQQMASLDKHLRNQRHFMDEQAAEREHEREEFQQEIQRLEGQLRQAARPQPQGPLHSPVSQPSVELLQQKLREKSDAFNELVIKKELADRQVLIQEEEIKHLEEMNANTRRKVVQLQEELEKQRKAVKELQVKQALKEQQMTHLLLESTLQSERGEGRCPGPPADGPPTGPEVPWGAAQRAPLQRDGEVMCARSSEIEELKATIENLQENQERLQKDKAEEIERLHEVIEKLQQELSVTAPAMQGASDSRVGSLQSELLCSQAEGPCGQALQGELQAALAAKEALSQLLADQAHRHSQALQALQQRLQGAEEAAARQLAELGRSAALREAEVEGMAARVREFEATLKAKEATIAERDLEIDAVNRWKAAHSSALKAVLSAVARLRGALEQQPLAGPAEPPELQRLRAQCVRLSRQLQVLNQRSLRCQMELDRQQAHGACRHPDTLGSVVSLCVYPFYLQGKEKGLEDCQLQKVDLIAQVKQLQEKLNHLVYSVTFQDVNTADFKFQQPLASAFGSENSSSDGSHSGEETDTSPPVDAFGIHRTMRDLTDATKDQDYLIRSEMLDFPIQEKSELQDGSHSLPARVHGGALSRSDLAEPLKSPVRVLDLSSWSSPEVLRKDSALEPQPSLPLTPRSDVLSLRSADASLQDGTQASLLLAAEPGLLCSPGVSAAGQAPPWAESPPADHQPVERMPVEKDVEDFIITSFDSQETLRSPPPGLEENNDGSEEISDYKIALLQMVREESCQILALSEGHGAPSTLGRGEPCAPLDPIPREGQSLLEAAPRKGEKEPSDVRLGWRGEFLQVVQAAFDKEWRTLKLPLQPGLDSSDPGRDCLLERLEKVVQAQGDLQETSLEHLRVPDRSSLLSEVQALRAQLRLTHLQNQEKLQQLCAALTSVEARGSWQEHQLRRQVELLAYKVEQEKCIASDLQKTLGEEQEKANGVRKLLAAEQSAVKALKSELCECRQENERLLKSLDDVQQEVLQLRWALAVSVSRCTGLPVAPHRSMLDGKESNLQAALRELECERGKEHVLQSRLEEQQLRHLQREGQSSKSLEELRTSLEKQRAQSSRLGVALKHEQTARDNLQKELRIEHSRFEALLAQERAQLCQLQKDLEAEKSHSLELSEALQHERLLTEQLSRRTQEACAQQDVQAQQALLRELQEEKARVRELQAVLDTVQQQAVRTQQQLEELRREKERELQLQRQREEHKIRQLQRTVRELESKEEALRGGLHRGAPPGARGSDGPDQLREQQQELEKTRQQLLCAAGLLTSFVRQTVGRTVSDWASSNEKAVASLLHTLEELKPKLSRPTPCQKKMAAELQVQLVEVLLRDNDSLTKALTVAAEEKSELSRAVSKLEKTLKHHVQKGCALSRSDRPAWRQDRTVPQSSQHSDPGRPPPAASAEANTCNVRMEKLYLHYLRAESFRKALIYQKKYLLLLIGGFQDSEQETLSMIAHLGVFPSKADKKITTSRPFTKFRTAVRVVIMGVSTKVYSFLFLIPLSLNNSGAGPRASRQQRSPESRESPPTRDVSSGHTRDPARGPGPAAAASPGRRGRSTPSPNSRLERSLTASEDPEPSLTEYIHHLETIQQRLGGLPPDFTSKKSCHQKSKQ
uniref:Pericentrin n=1 Tax=Prolemur simus TaxID=1328070 RepID=A0A8C8YXY6_PROSS